MKKRDFDNIIDNEREWRRFLLGEVMTIKKEVATLKARVAVISSAVGSVMGVIISWIKAKAGI